MGYVMRCDDSHNVHDLQRGERYLEVRLMNEHRAATKTLTLCADHAHGRGFEYVEGLFNGKWSSVEGTWREA